MLIAVVAMAIFITGCLVALIIGLASVQKDIQGLNDKLDQLTSLSLNPRTRIGQATMQSGAVSEEQKLERLGRASVARRVVVGGDDDSRQKQDLMRSTERADNG